MGLPAKRQYTRKHSNFVALIIDIEKEHDAADSYNVPRGELEHTDPASLLIARHLACGILENVLDLYCG